MKNKYPVLLIILFFLNTAVTAQLKDIDGNQYKTVQIDKQEWMAENLDVSHFRNGDVIPEAESTEDWIKAGSEGKPAWCYYQRDSNSVTIYNKLYNWYAVNDSRGLAPEGWHVPSKPEWAMLTGYLAGDNTAGTSMKSATEWDGAKPGGLDCLPGGYRNNSGSFEHAGKIGSWWSSTEADDTDAWSVSLGTGTPAVSTSFDYKRVGLSVRCIKN